jgi:hypothetical protein
MVTIQPIEHDGHVVALVRAKCLYALEVQVGERPGPYSDEAATRYALAHSHPARSRTWQRR